MEGLGVNLQRLVIETKPEELIIRVLYRSKGESNPGTKARTCEVTDLARSGLRDALEALEGEATVCGTSGYTTREDLLVVDTKDATIASEAEGRAT
jgi:hypothetical protein